MAQSTWAAFRNDIRTDEQKLEAVYTRYESATTDHAYANYDSATASDDDSCYICRVLMYFYMVLHHPK